MGRYRNVVSKEALVMGLLLGLLIGYSANVDVFSKTRLGRNLSASAQPAASSATPSSTETAAVAVRATSRARMDATWLSIAPSTTTPKVKLLILVVSGPRPDNTERRTAMRSTWLHRFPDSKALFVVSTAIIRNHPFTITVHDQQVHVPIGTVALY